MTSSFLEALPRIQMGAPCTREIQEIVFEIQEIEDQTDFSRCHGLVAIGEKIHTSSILHSEH